MGVGLFYLWARSASFYSHVKCINFCIDGVDSFAPFQRICVFSHLAFLKTEMWAPNRYSIMRTNYWWPLQDSCAGFATWVKGMTSAWRGSTQIFEIKSSLSTVKTFLIALIKKDYSLSISRHLRLGLSFFSPLFELCTIFLVWCTCHLGQKYMCFFAAHCPFLNFVSH